MTNPSSDLLLLRIPDGLEGQRLDKALSAHPLIGSRSKAAQLIDEGRVTTPHRKDSKLKASLSVRSGEEYHVQLPPPEPTHLVPLDLPLDIVFEDDDLLVVNKPAGLVVHPAAGHAQDTLVNALLHKVKNFSMGFGEARPGIVHRLDKDTSGLLVVAKSDFIQDGLVAQFKARTVSRLYKALVLGRPLRDQGVIESHLTRHPSQRKKFASVKISAESNSSPKGKLAITHYNVIDRHALDLSLIECRLKTGRTHQIRIHMSELGHPLVGDRLYGSSAREAKIKSASVKTHVSSLRRIGLHAAELGFVHPRTKAELFFKATWPEDLLPLLTELGWNHVE